MFSRFKKKRLEKDCLLKEQQINEGCHNETLELLKDAHDMVGVFGAFLTSYLKYMKSCHEMSLLHAVSYNLYQMEGRLQGQIFKFGSNTNSREKRTKVICNPPYLEVNLRKSVEEYLAGRDLESVDKFLKKYEEPNTKEL